MTDWSLAESQVSLLLAYQTAPVNPQKVHRGFSLPPMNFLQTFYH